MGLTSLKTKGEFELVFSQGSKVVGKYAVVYSLKVGDGTQSRAGVIASKKVGNAVSRNRAKRLLREAFRQLRPAISHSIHAIIIARPKILSAKCQEVMTELRGFLDIN